MCVVIHSRTLPVQVDDGWAWIQVDEFGTSERQISDVLPFLFLPAASGPAIVASGTEFNQQGLHANKHSSKQVPLWHRSLCPRTFPDAEYSWELVQRPLAVPSALRMQLNHP